MARVTVEDCLTKVENRFQLVLIAAKRAHQLALGAESRLDGDINDKVTVQALREIAEDKITPEEINRIHIKPKPVITESFKPDAPFEF